MLHHVSITGRVAANREEAIAVKLAFAGGTLDEFVFAVQSRPIVIGVAVFARRRHVMLQTPAVALLVTRNLRAFTVFSDEGSRGRRG